MSKQYISRANDMIVSPEATLAIGYGSSYDYAVLLYAVLEECGLYPKILKSYVYDMAIVYRLDCMVMLPYKKWWFGKTYYQYYVCSPDKGIVPLDRFGEWLDVIPVCYMNKQSLTYIISSPQEYRYIDDGNAKVPVIDYTQPIDYQRNLKDVFDIMSLYTDESGQYLFDTCWEELPCNLFKHWRDNYVSYQKANNQDGSRD
jgi:hypothetical protein